MNTITKSDFLTMVKLNHLEVLTQDQVTENCKLVQSYIRKSLVNELDEIEKADSNTIVTELGFLEKWEVMRDDFSKAIVYTRRTQIDWEEPEYGELGELVKAKGGVYKDTHENKKLGRVGQKYGEKKSESKSLVVEKKLYDWGELVTVSSGKNWKAILHPEHQKKITALRDSESTTIKDEQNMEWKITKSSDKYQIEGTGQTSSNYKGEFKL